MDPVAHLDLSGWGNFPTVSAQVARPEQGRSVAEIVADARGTGLIARGMGRSYGDQAVQDAGTTVVMTRLNRMLALDASPSLDGEAVLRCEAGVTLAEIIRHLLPRGLFPPVTPGTKFVTVGGAIANDVHGKNHHIDGSFARFVLDFTLLLPSGEHRVCSRGENPDLFWATVGGMGLTGIILEARLRLRRVPSAYLTVQYLRSANLDETIDLFSSTDASSRYSVAWLDCLARGRHAGRAVLMNADHTAAEELPHRAAVHPFHPELHKPRAIPVPLPGGMVNPLTVSAFNALYYAVHPTRRVVTDYERFFYPLDAVENWTRIYGRTGFVQCQAVFPEEEGSKGLVDMLLTLRQGHKPSFLAVLKRMGPASGGMLSFPRPGWTLAVDIPVTRDLHAFMDRLHQRVLHHGGSVYLAKDATLRRELLAPMYPRLGELLRVKSAVDPSGRVGSAMSHRLGIGGDGA